MVNHVTEKKTHVEIFYEKIHVFVLNTLLAGAYVDKMFLIL